jgi:hypothetical protein
LFWLKACFKPLFSFGDHHAGRRRPENEGGAMHLLRHWLPKNTRFQSTIHWLSGSPSDTLPRWTKNGWVILLWVCGIPLITIAFLTMLFWVYGATD